MTPLTEMLTRAAGDDAVGFDARTVRRRVERRMRRQRAAIAVAVVAVLVVGAGALAVARGGDEGPVADPAGVGPVTSEELVVAPWVLIASSGVTSESSSVSLAFNDRGGLLNTGGCLYNARWELAGGRLRTSDVRSYDDCDSRGSVLDVVLATSSTVGRFGDRAGTLELRAGDAFVALERADRIGRTPRPGELVGEEWIIFDTAPFAFAPDGTYVLGSPQCRQRGEWELDGDQMLLAPDGEGEDETGQRGYCGFLRMAEEDPLHGTSTVRIDGDRLVLATSQIAIQLQR